MKPDDPTPRANSAERRPRATASRPLFGAKPLRNLPKASELIARQIRTMILDGKLADGDLLPPESQLSAEFGVARPTLREAFRILETEGLIQVVRGSRRGARVNAPKIATAARYAAYSLRAAGATLAETYDAQLAIEPYAVRLLAMRSEPVVIEALEIQLAELERLDPESEMTARRVALARFHLRLARLTGNRTLAVMAEVLTEILEFHQAVHRPPVDQFAVTMSEEDFRALGVRSIRKLITLIRAGDVEGAEAHWRLHLRNAARFWLTGLDPAAVIDVAK